MRAFSCSRLAGTLAVLALVPAASGSAQQSFIAQDFGRTVGLELVLPNYEPDEIGSLTGAAYLSGGVPVGRSSRLIIELPVAHFDPSFDGFEGATSRFGNPYLGLEIGGAAPVSGRIGVRAPLASSGDFEDGVPLELALLGDFDRFEAFVPRLVTVGAIVQARHSTPNGFVVRAIIGPDFMISTDGGDPELFGRYGAETGYERNGSAVLAGFTGRIIVTEGGASLGQRTVHQLTFSGSHRFGSVRPQVSVRLPLDSDLGDMVNYALGFAIKVDI